MDGAPDGADPDKPPASDPPVDDELQVRGPGSAPRSTVSRREATVVKRFGRIVMLTLTGGAAGLPPTVAAESPIAHSQRPRVGALGGAPRTFLPPPPLVAGGRVWPSGAHVKLEMRIVRTPTGATLSKRQ